MTNQDFVFTISTAADAATSLSQTIPTNFAIIRDRFTGASAPLSPLTNQLWCDATNGTARAYDGAAWAHTGPSHGRPAPLAKAVMNATATGTLPLCCHEHIAVVTGLALFHKTATTSDASNLWTWNLRNLVTNNTLFATPPTTNGNDLVAVTRKLLIPDQNLTLAAGAALQFEFTETGTASALVDLLVTVYGYLATP
jgi:hypothetical protein